MRILQLVQRPQRRGAEIFAYQLSDALRRCHHVVKTVYLYPSNADKTLPLLADDELLAGNEFHWMEKIPGVHLRLLKQLRCIVDEFHPDIIQVNGARTIKYGAFLKKGTRSVSWSLIYRNIDNPAFWIQDRLRLWFYRDLVMPEVDGVIGVSQMTLDNVRDMYKITAPMRYIPNGIDTERLDHTSAGDLRAQFCLSADIPIVLFIGNLSRQKRPDLFVQIVAQLRQACPEIQGWIVGDGPERGNVMQQIAMLDLENNVKVWGYQEQVGDYIAAADLLLVTSDSDGIPAVILEAGYLGKPVVARQIGGIAECVLDGETAILIDSQGTSCFVEPVFDLLQNDEKRRDMGAAARRWISKHFAIDPIAEQYLEFYNHARDAM